MKKVCLLVAVMMCIAISISGCSNKALEEANAAVEAYNAQAEAYNKLISPYNAAVQEISENNQALEDTVSSAQEAIDQGEQPFDEATLTVLKEAMSEAIEGKVSSPEMLPEYEQMAVDEEAKKEELESVTEKALTSTEDIEAFELPEIPEVPDYSEVITKVDEAKSAYTNSIQSLKQITAPSDDFVMERLQRIETITSMGAVSEDHDPNGFLNKQGGYIGCIYFTDTQVNRSNLYIEAGKDNPIDVGCDGGGAIEIFRSTEDAEKRDAYLGQFDGTIFAPGSHYVYGTIIVRTSDELNGTKQLELTDKIVDALTAVE